MKKVTQYLLFVFSFLFSINCLLDLDRWELFDVDTYSLAIKGQRMIKAGFPFSIFGDFTVYHWDDTTQTWSQDVSEPDLGAQRVALTSTGAWLRTGMFSVKNLPIGSTTWVSMSLNANELKTSTNDDVLYLSFPLNPATGEASIFKVNSGIVSGAYANQIGADSTGQVWALASDLSIKRQQGATWSIVPGLARDVTIGSGDITYIVSNTPETGGFKIQKWHESNQTWETVPGIGGIGITLDSNNHLYVITSSGEVYRERGFRTTFCPSKYFF